MKKVCYDIYDTRLGGHYWNMEFQNKREAESYLYHALRDDFYNGNCGPFCQLRKYIENEQQYLKVVDRTPEKPKTKKQLEAEEQERKARIEQSLKENAERDERWRVQTAQAVQDLYDTSKITEDLVALKVDDVKVEVRKDGTNADINVIAGGVCVYHNMTLWLSQPMFFDKDKKLLYVSRKWLKRRSKEVKALVVRD